MRSRMGTVASDPAGPNSQEEVSEGRPLALVTSCADRLEDTSSPFVAEAHPACRQDLKPRGESDDIAVSNCTASVSMLSYVITVKGKTEHLAETVPISGPKRARSGLSIRYVMGGRRGDRDPGPIESSRLLMTSSPDLSAQ